MVFYEIELLSAPRILFAYSVETEKYRNSFYNRENFLEISVCEEGRMVFDHRDREKEIASPGMIVPILKDMCCETYSMDSGRQRHTTVGVRVEYRIRRYAEESECDVEALGKRIKGGNVMLLPYFYDPGDRLGKIMATLKEITACYSAESPEAPMLALSRWYRLCAGITEAVYAVISHSKAGIKPSEQMYVRRAVECIGGINGEGLSVKEVAARLNISEGYLHRIFKKSMNCTILEYINRKKIVRLIELVENGNLTLKEAAANVGIDDPAYASRLFRKVTDLSFSEYFQKSKAMSERS